MLYILKGSVKFLLQLRDHHQFFTQGLFEGRGVEGVSALRMPVYCYVTVMPLFVLAALQGVSVPSY